jgi:hypothetical protein
LIETAHGELVMTDLRLIAYETVPSETFRLETAPRRRAWMDSTKTNAYRCLPLVMANQAGWLLHNPWTVRVRWSGDNRLDIAAHGPVPGSPVYLYPMNIFGGGIVTWTLPFLFRTPPGYNMLVRGPANYVKDGVAPLEGLVETDHTEATFTCNYKITRPDTWITFEQGEPICMVVPQRRGELEEFTLEIIPISDEPELEAANSSWCESRDQFNLDVNKPGTEAAKWQRTYLRSAKQTRLHLRSAEEDR